jgi:hypothetical protein
MLLRRQLQEWLLLLLRLLLLQMSRRSRLSCKGAIA